MATLPGTHVFQLIRPLHPQANAICARCGLALPHGPILLFRLAPCADVRPPPVQNNG